MLGAVALGSAGHKSASGSTKQRNVTAPGAVIHLRAFQCKSHPTCDSRIFKISSYFNQLKIKVILEYGKKFSFIKHFVEFLGGGGGGGREVELQQYIFKKCKQCPQAIF